VIEVWTIDERHRQRVLLEEFGTKIIFRLTVDPVRLAPDVVKRQITKANNTVVPVLDVAPL
jgi:hypothetical protein